MVQESILMLGPSSCPLLDYHKYLFTLKMSSSECGSVL